MEDGRWITKNGHRIYIRTKGVSKNGGTTKEIKSPVVNNAPDEIADYLYDETGRDEVSKSEIDDYINNDFLDDELSDYQPTKDEYEEVYKELKKRGYKVLDNETNEAAETSEKKYVDKNDIGAINKIADNNENIDNYEGLDDITKDYIKNRRKEMAQKEFTDKANEIHEKTKDKAIEAEKTTDENKRFNTNEDKKNELDDNNYHTDKELRKKDYENDLQWFENMEKEHPSKGGLANNEEYQALKADYEAEFGKKESKSVNQDRKDLEEKYRKSGVYSEKEIQDMLNEDDFKKDRIDRDTYEKRKGNFGEEMASDTPEKREERRKWREERTNPEYQRASNGGYEVQVGEDKYYYNTLEELKEDWGTAEEVEQVKSQREKALKNNREFSDYSETKEYNNAKKYLEGKSTKQLDDDYNKSVSGEKQLTDIDKKALKDTLEERRNAKKQETSKKINEMFIRNNEGKVEKLDMSEVEKIEDAGNKYEMKMKDGTMSISKDKVVSVNGKEQESSKPATPRDEVKYALEHNEFDYARRAMKDYGLEDEKEQFLENLKPEARKEFKIYDERESKKESNAESSRRMEEDFAKGHNPEKVSSKNKTDNKNELDDNNYHKDKELRKKDYENDMKFFEDMEKKYPSKGGLEANKDYQALKKDYESEFGSKKNNSGDSFKMYNSQYDKEVTVKKGADGKWVDSDGNKYMGYLSKDDVKKYFKGNWQETKETRSASQIISDQMSKTAKAQDETAKALGIKRDKENGWKTTAQLYKEQKGKDLVETAINSKDAKKYNDYVEKNHSWNDKNFGDRKAIDEYAKTNNLDADSLYYMTKIASESDRRKLKEASESTKNNGDWVRNAFNQYKKEHPGTKMTFANFKKNNLK